MSSAVLAAAVGAVAFAAPAPSSPAQASVAPQDRLGVVRNYTIAPGTLGGALNEIADQNNVHVLYPAGATRGWRTPGLVGAYSLTEALDRLLVGTSLTYRFDANGKSVSIVLAQADNGVRSDAGAEPLPPIEIGAPRPPANGPSNGKPVLTPQNSYVTPVVSVGTKTDVPVMNTPVNVQAITQKAIEDQQAITLGEALRNVSGVYTATSVTTGTFSRTGGIFVRGFITPNIYRDGFRVDSGSSGNIDVIGSRQLGNVGSVEALKGPAAILYGLSEPGGIINITTRDPQDAPHYSLTQQIGSLALYRTSIGATGPLTQDKSFLYRLDMSYENNGAPYGSLIDLTHSQNFFVAPVVKWNLSESTSLKAEVEYSNDQTSLYRGTGLLYRGSFVTLPRDLNYWENSPSHAPTIFAALSLSHQFDNDWSIKQRVAFNRLDFSTTITNPSGTISSANPTVLRNTSTSEGAQTTFSTNLDIVGHFDLLGARNTLLLGGDFYRTSYNQDGLGGVPWGSSRISFAAPIHPGVPTASASTVSTTSFNRQDTAGLYLQEQVELPYGVHIMAGARYQRVRQESSSTSAILSPSKSVTASTIEPTDAERVTPRFGLLWRPQQWVSLYGNYTEGFGVNSGLVYPGTLAPPSDARSWEAGAKFEFFDGRLRATVDYYDLVKTNIPIGDPDPSHVCGGGGCVVLAGEARSRGPEVDIQGEILPGWNVIVTYTNQDVRITNGNIQGFSFGSLLPGQRFPHVPRNLASLSTTYEFQEAPLKGLKIGASYTYHGSQPILDASGGIPGAAPLLASWGTVDLMAGYSFDLDGLKTKTQINVTNLFDKTYYTDAYFPAATSGFTLSGRRSYGAPFAVRGSLGFEF